MVARDDNGNTIKLPKALAWLMALTLFAAGGAWATQVVLGEMARRKQEAMNTKLEHMSADIADLRFRVAVRTFTRADADSLEERIMNEVRKSRGAMHQRMDDFEYRMNQIARAQAQRGRWR